MNSKNFGFLAVGLSLGAAVALLYAPRSGKVTRRYVRSKATSGVRYVRDQGENIKRSATDQIERGKRGLQDTKSHLAAAIDAGRDAYRDAQVG